MGALFCSLVVECLLFSDNSNSNDVVLLAQTLVNDMGFALAKRPEEGKVFGLDGAA
jgi:hypothetical protein